MSRAHPTELTVLFQRRPRPEQVCGREAFSEFDLFWPDGRPVNLGQSRFCSIGSRLLLGRRYEGKTALIRLTIQPVAGLNAALTRLSGGVRCRRLYAVRRGDAIRLHFLDGTPTEVVFHDTIDEPSVLCWLQVERMSPGEPFWFDLASQALAENCGPADS
jgi:hypothetical protein